MTGSFISLKSVSYQDLEITVELDFTTLVVAVDVIDLKGLINYRSLESVLLSIKLKTDRYSVTENSKSASMLQRMGEWNIRIVTRLGERMRRGRRNPKG